MNGEVELVGDDDGVVVIGDNRSVERFLRHAGLIHKAKPFDLRPVGSYLGLAAESTQIASRVVEQSARYLKLTPDSTQALKDAGGLMRSKVAGVSHAVLGDPGRVDSWLQVEEGVGSLLTNPAVLAGLGGFLTLAAQQAEAQELRAFLVRIDGKLDDVRRRQRDEVLARLSSAATAIDEARVIRENGGDPQTLWDKVNGTSTMITNVQEDALLALGASADKAAKSSKMRDVKSAAAELEQEVALQLAVLGRCFELQDEFETIELDHVLVTAPERFKGHSLGKAEMRRARRAEVLARVGWLLKQMDGPKGIAAENVVLHAKAARAVVGSLDRTLAAVDEFTKPLGVPSAGESCGVPLWREAIRDPQSLRRASAEITQKAVVSVVAAGGVAIMAHLSKDSSSDGS